MNILDIIILICLVPAVIQGIRKGFISQAISIISLIAGIWASAKFANMVGAWLAQYITASEQVLRLTAFALILVVVFVVLGMIGKLLEGIIKLIMLGWMNKLLGVAFAILKCVLGLGFLAMVFTSVNESWHLVKPEVLNDSVLYPIIKDIADNVFPYLKSLLTLK